MAGCADREERAAAPPGSAAAMARIASTSCCFEASDCVTSTGHSDCTTCATKSSHNYLGSTGKKKQKPPDRPQGFENMWVMYLVEAALDEGGTERGLL